MAENPFTYEKALRWLESHPAEYPHLIRFQNQASELGDDVVPAMIEVLTRGPIQLHLAAGLVLAHQDIGTKTFGTTIEDFGYRLTGPGPHERMIRPQNLKAPDINEDAFFTVDPMLTPSRLRRFFRQYVLMFAVAVGLAVAGAKSGGITGNVLWIVAGLLFAVTLWSVLFMTVMQGLQRWIKRLNMEDDSDD